MVDQKAKWDTVFWTTAVPDTGVPYGQQDEDCVWGVECYQNSPLFTPSEGVWSQPGSSCKAPNLQHQPDITTDAYVTFKNCYIDIYSLKKNTLKMKLNIFLPHYWVAPFLEYICCSWMHMHLFQRIDCEIDTRESCVQVLWSADCYSEDSEPT